MKIATLIEKDFVHIRFPRICLHAIYQKWKSVSYDADAQTERLKMLTSLHIDWEGDFVFNIG